MNENIKAIINKRKIKKTSHLCKTVIITFNITAICILLNFYQLIIRLKKSDYHNKNLYNSSMIDPFIGEKLDLIINIFIIMSLFILLSCFILLLVLSMNWLKKIKNEYIIHKFLGYNKWQIKKMVIIDSEIEYFLSIPFSVILSLTWWHIITENNMLQQIFIELDMWKTFNMRIFPIVIVFVIILELICALYGNIYRNF